MKGPMIESVLEKAHEVEEKINALFHEIDLAKIPFEEKQLLMEELEKHYLNLYINTLYPLTDAYPLIAQKYEHYPFDVFALTSKDKYVIETVLLENTTYEWKKVSKIIMQSVDMVKSAHLVRPGLRIPAEYYNYILKKIIYYNKNNFEIRGNLNMMRYSEVKYRGK